MLRCCAFRRAAAAPRSAATPVGAGFPAPRRTIARLAGDDTVHGGSCDDDLYGNEGLNTFVFNPGDTDFESGASTGDTIMDFATGTSRVDFGSIQALAQQLISGGDTDAFVADGVDGVSGVDRAREGAMARHRSLPSIPSWPGMTVERTGALATGFGRRPGPLRRHRERSEASQPRREPAARAAWHQSSGSSGAVPLA